MGFSRFIFYLKKNEFYSTLTCQLTGQANDKSPHDDMYTCHVAYKCVCLCVWASVCACVCACIGLLG